MNWDWRSWDWRKVGPAAGAVLVCLILAVWLWPAGPGAVAHPGGYKMECQNPSCRNEFTISLSRAEEFRKHPDQPIKCPKCGGTEVVEAGARTNRRPPASPTTPGTPAGGT